MQKKERLCVSCRQHFDKDKMLRVAKVDGQFTLDVNNKFEGRGAYVCSDCRDKISKKKLLNKSFKQAVPDEIYKQIEDYGKNS